MYYFILFIPYLIFFFLVKMAVLGTHELSDRNWLLVWEMSGAWLTAANQEFVTKARNRSYVECLVQAATMDLCALEQSLRQVDVFSIVRCKTPPR